MFSLLRSLTIFLGTASIMASSKQTLEPGAGMIYRITPQQRESLLSSNTKDFQSGFASLLHDIRKTFEKEGLVLIRGLFEDQLLQRLCQEGQLIAQDRHHVTTFSSLRFGPVFSFPNKEEEEENSQEDQAKVVTGQPFRETALTSAIPAFIARVLLGWDDDESNTNVSSNKLRLLKDAFMAKGREQDFCGWHVDDIGFWPTSAESDGINVWVALDDMPSHYAGGLAVSPQSHNADWRHDAYHAIGSVKVLPPEGVELGSPSSPKVQTCSMSTVDPLLHDKIEATKVVFDFQKGDCLFCTRWLFHRSMPINEEGLKYYEMQNMEPLLKRYSIRYVPGTAHMIRGLCTEPCVLLNPETSGQSLDKICDSQEGEDGGMSKPFYPQCWPRQPDSDDQEARIKALVMDQFVSVESKREEIMQKIRASYQSDQKKN